MSWIGSILNLGFWILDHFESIDIISVGLYLRLATSAIVALAALLFRFGSVHRKMAFLIVNIEIAALSIQVSFLCTQLGGFRSSYFAGNFLVLAAVPVLPWPVLPAAIACAIILVGYVGINLIHSPFSCDMLTPILLLFGNSILALIATNIGEKSRRRDRTNQDKIKQQAKAVEDLARQLAHDIRSPVSALNIAVTKIDGISAENRALLQTATGRINEIANDLLKRGSSKSERTAKACNVLPYIEQILAEKKVQLLNSQIEIIEPHSRSNFFAEFVPSEFCRLFSNLITNSIDAIDAKGKVSIDIDQVGLYVEVVIKDTGKGIPRHLLERIGEAGFSYGKSNEKSGAGLGLYQAKKLLEAWGGKLEITSILGRGTTVKIKLRSNTFSN